MESIKDILKRETPQNYQTGKQAIPSLRQTPNWPALLKPLNEMASSLNINLENTLDNYKVPPGDKDVKFAFRKVLDCSPRFMLLAYGGVGNGKTHLCNAASIELYKRGLYCRVMSFDTILQVLRSAINNPELRYDQLLDNYSYGDRLIIDDIGAGGSDTDFANKVLEAIVCARYGHQKLTIMTMNKDLSALPERVLSRLQDKSTSFLVHNRADDYRMKKEAL